MLLAAEAEAQTLTCYMCLGTRKLTFCVCNSQNIIKLISSSHAPTNTAVTQPQPQANHGGDLLTEWRANAAAGCLI